MAIELMLYGPYEVPFDRERRYKFIDTYQKRAFIRMLDDEGISEKQGCYVFAMRASKGYRPWYVGKATKTIRQECIGTHQLQHYNAVLSMGMKGTPVMFFVLPDGKRKKVPRRICNEMEGVLIQSAYYRNPLIRNVQKAKVPEWGIDGVLRGKHGKPKNIEVSFRTMMGL